MVQPLEWSVCNVCVAYARTSMPRVTRGPRRPPRHAWHRLAQASLASPAAASLPSIMAAPALAMGAAGEASGRSFEALSAKMNVLVSFPRILSLCVHRGAVQSLSSIGYISRKIFKVGQRMKLVSWAPREECVFSVHEQTLPSTACTLVNHSRV